MANHLTTPTTVSSAIRSFCALLGVLEDPKYVDVETRTHSLAAECFGNVDKVVSGSGGDRQLGWMILEWPGVLLEARFHAVWRRRDGTYVDVTPQEEFRILFVADAKATYTRQRVPSRFQALSADLHVAAFIAASERLWRFEQSHWFDNGSDAGIEVNNEQEEETYRLLQWEQAGALRALNEWCVRRSS